MLDRTLKIKELFAAFKTSVEILTKSYKQYDDVVKQDILFDFENEFMQELNYYIANSDECDLLEDYKDYKYK